MIKHLFFFTFISTMAFSDMPVLSKISGSGSYKSPPNAYIKCEVFDMGTWARVVITKEAGIEGAHVATTSTTSVRLSGYLKDMINTVKTKNVPTPEYYGTAYFVHYLENGFEKRQPLITKNLNKTPAEQTAKALAAFLDLTCN